MAQRAPAGLRAAGVNLNLVLYTTWYLNSAVATQYTSSLVVGTAVGPTRMWYSTLHGTG